MAERNYYNNIIHRTQLCRMSCTIVNNALTVTVQKPSKISAGVILCNIGRYSGGLITRTSQRYDNDGNNNTIFLSAIMSFQHLILSITFTILLFVS